MTPTDAFARFNELIGPGLASLGQDARRQFHAVAQSAFEKMDFVSREEFEAQKAVLLRTREKLEALEKDVAELEKRLEDST
ncbi:MAG: accessory factor UbiK family protein [Porticoccaceae bacterium]